MSYVNRMSNRQADRQTKSQTDRKSYRLKVVQTESCTAFQFLAYGAFKWNYDNGLTPDLETPNIFAV